MGNVIAPLLPSPLELNAYRDQSSNHMSTQVFSAAQAFLGRQADIPGLAATRPASHQTPRHLMFCSCYVLPLCLCSLHAMPKVLFSQNVYCYALNKLKDVCSSRVKTN